MSRPKKKGYNKRDVDESFDAFLKESISSEESSIDTARIMKFMDPHNRSRKARDPSRWMEHVDEEDDDSDMGLMGTGSKFMKKTKKPEPTRDAKPTQKSGEKSVSFSQDVGMSRDSLDDESFGVGRSSAAHRGSAPVPALALSLGSSQSMTDTITGTQPKTLGAGKETLDELADKERFFKELEKSSDDTLDYSRLNREMDGSATLAATLDNIDESQEDDDSDEVGSPQLTAKKISNRQGAATNKDTDMLSKVALIDSLDSTLGAKVAGSRETHESDDMDTIPEGTREEDVTHEEVRRLQKRAHFEDEDGLDGHHLEDDTDGNKAVDSRGFTLKTTGTTGMGYTDTSREIEALHSAMRHQVGMATLDDTKDFTFKDSSTNHTQDMTDGDGTGAFGLRAVALPKYDKSQRTADDIMREVQEITGHSTDGARHLYTVDEDNIDGPDGHGFDLTPAHGGGYGMMDTTDTTGEDGYDITPFEKYLPKHSDPESSQMTPPRSRSQFRGQGHESPDGSYPVPAQRIMKDKAEKKPKFTSVKSSGYGQRSPSPRRSTNKTSQKSWNPAEIQKHKIKGTDSTAKVKKNLDAGRQGGDKPTATSSLADNHLVQSVQSFASYIQDQFASFTPSAAPAAPAGSGEFYPDSVTSSHQKMAALEREHKLVREVQEWQDQWKEERRLLAKVKVELAAVERDCKNKVEQMRIEHEQEMFKLKQENYVLSAKIAEDTETRPPLDLDSLDGANKEQVALFEKEVREQEKLLAGYQQENERLYGQLKKIQLSNKGTEEKMFRENQKMNTEVANLREQLSVKEQQLKNKGIITAPSVQQQIAAGNTGSAILGAGRIAQLEAQLKQAKGRETTFKLEIDTLNQTCKELGIHIDQLVQQNELLESKLKDSSFTETQATKGNLLKYEKEIDRLKNKLKWYAENQEFLDRDANKIKHQDEEIYKLKQKLESVKTEAGKKTSEARVKAKERSQDGKKIQDLERQVREMETILRKRHPNSLPVLMWAASNASDANDNKAPSVVYLEKRILKLETELELKDEEAKKGLRVVEQKYHAMKVQYEERIESLEKQLSHDQRPDDRKLKEGEQPHTHVSALQRQLDSVKDRHKKKLAEMEMEMEKVKRELVTSRSKENAAKASESRLAKEVESETSLRVKALQIEVANQEREKQQMQKIIERLQMEKNQIAVDMTRSLGQANKAQGEKLQSKLQSKTKVLSKAGKRKEPVNADQKSGDIPLPTYQDQQTQDKQYEPMIFAGHHISDILQENDQLKQKVEMLQLDVEQQRIMSQKLVAEGEALTRRSREDSEDKVMALKSAHQAEVQKLLSDQAINHSSSRIAQLQGQVNTQEVVTKHLRDQLSQNAVDRERMSMLNIRETTLEAQLKQLGEELQNAKQMHTPEMKHFMSLQDKIRDMETRHGQRERELQTIIQHSRTMAHADMADEINKWRRQVDTKNQELERFRLELDSILDVLKELRRQGVVLPYRGASSHSSSNR